MPDRRRPTSTATSACPPSWAIVMPLRVNRHTGRVATTASATAAVTTTSAADGSGWLLNRRSGRSPRRSERLVTVRQPATPSAPAVTCEHGRGYAGPPATADSAQWLTHRRGARRAGRRGGGVDGRPPRRGGAGALAMGRQCPSGRGPRPGRARAGRLARERATDGPALTPGLTPPECARRAGRWRRSGQADQGLADLAVQRVLRG